MKLKLTRKKTEKVRLYALKVQHLVEKGCYKESDEPWSIEKFARGLPDKLEDVAHKRQVNYTSTATELFIPFRRLVKHVDAEEFTTEKLLNLDLPREIKIITSKVATQNFSSETHESKNECIFTQTNDSNNRSLSIFPNPAITAIYLDIFNFQMISITARRQKKPTKFFYLDPTLLQIQSINFSKRIKTKFVQMDNLPLIP